MISINSFAQTICLFAYLGSFRNYRTFYRRKR